MILAYGAGDIKPEFSCKIIFRILFALSRSKAWKQYQASRQIENEHTKYVKGVFHLHAKRHMFHAKRHMFHALLVLYKTVNFTSAQGNYTRVRISKRRMPLDNKIK